MHFTVVYSRVNGPRHLITLVGQGLSPQLIFLKSEVQVLANVPVVSRASPQAFKAKP